MFINKKSLAGFTLVEIMVAVSIFSIVAVIAVGALLTANTVNQKAQATKLIMDNLNFAMDSMIFKMRKSGAYYCSASGSNIPGYSNNGQACVNGNTMLVLRDKASDSRQYIYFFEVEGERGVVKFLDTGPDGSNTDKSKAVTLTAAVIDIDRLFFYVPGTSPSRAMLTLFGQAKVGKATTEFALETVAAERR